MKKILFISFLLATSQIFIAQEKLQRHFSVQSRATKPSTNELQLNVEKQKSTVFFNDNTGKSNSQTVQPSNLCSIYLFDNVSEAQEFAGNIKASDSNILDFYFTGVKDNVYFFSFSVKEPREAKWYFQLFKNNGLQYVNYNGATDTIDQALAK